MYSQKVLIALTLLSVAGCGGDSNSISPETETVDLNLAPRSIDLDPNSVAPLSARLQFEAPEPGELSIRVNGRGADGVDIYHRHEGVVEGDVDHPVLGLYANHVNEIFIELKGVSGKIYEDQLLVATQSLPWNFEPEIQIIANDIVDDEGRVYMFSRQQFAFDSNGDIRWVYLGNSLDIFRKQPSGSLLADIDENVIGYHSPAFAEISMLGEKSQEIFVKNYIHHEVRLLPWGNYLVASNSSLIDFDTNGVPEEDVLIEVDSSNGTIVKTWDFNIILDPERPPIPSNSRSDDWLHLNSAVYNESDNSIYITSQRQSLAAKIDYETGELIWILAAHKQWKESFQGKLLTAVDEAGAVLELAGVDFWPYGPHAILPLGDGRLALYDNGSYRGWYDDDSVPANSYSRAVEYKVDEERKTVQLVWEYTAGKNIFTPATGDIDILGEEGGFLIGFAGRSEDSVTPRVVEIDQFGEIVFEAISQPGNQEYRVEKFDLYSGL